MVLECAGSVVGPFAVVAGGEAVLPSLPQLLSPLIARLVSHHIRQKYFVDKYNFSLCSETFSGAKIFSARQIFCHWYHCGSKHVTALVSHVTIT